MINIVIKLFIKGFSMSLLGPVAQNLVRAGLSRLAGIEGDVIRTQESDGSSVGSQADWRVRLSLANGSEYLYNADGDKGILAPLKETNGVVFPYTPSIQVSYNAAYTPTDIPHANYKIYNYASSSIDQINIVATFTAQDTYEANYMLAVIHFFRSVTKMFYGNDQLKGTPPPLCFLSGLGSFQFNNHPIVISNFNYNLPERVDYIRAQPNPAPPGTTIFANGGNNLGGGKSPNIVQRIARLGLSILPGGEAPPTIFSPPRPGIGADATYVPTEMKIQLTAYPVVSRNDISNNFSLKEYATGSLIKKGIW
jgi:hypothetical protein